MLNEYPNVMQVFAESLKPVCATLRQKFTYLWFLLMTHFCKVILKLNVWEMGNVEATIALLRYLGFNPHMPWGKGDQIDPRSCVFLKNVSSIEKVEPWFFVTFNIILKHMFPENFIEFPQVVQKI